MKVMKDGHSSVPIKEPMASKLCRILTVVQYLLDPTPNAHTR